MTGSIQDKAPQVFMDLEYGSINVSFVNDSGAALTQGQEVVFKAAGTIDKRSTGAQFPLGVVVTGAEDGERAVVNVLASYTAEVEAAGTLVAGDFVYPNGNKNSVGRPIVAKCSTGQLSMAVVMKGGTVGTVVKVIYLRAVVTVL